MPAIHAVFKPNGGRLVIYAVIFTRFINCPEIS